MKVSCIIVDDEYLPLQLLEDYISKIPELLLIKKCKSAMEAKHVIENQQVDLLFLDIQLPDLSGMELMEKLESKPLVIFTSAYLEYAVEGFRLQAVDYLLKPFSFDRFEKAVTRAFELICFRNLNEQNKVTLENDDYILVKTDSKIMKLMIDEILYIEGLKEYVSIYTFKERIISLMALKYLETQLSDTRFLRVHKSYLVAINKIDALKVNSIEIGSKTIPIGRTYKEVIREKLKINFKEKLL